MLNCKTINHPYNIPYFKHFGKALYFWAKLSNLVKVEGFAKLYPPIPNHHIISGIKNHKRRGSPTTPMNPSKPEIPS